MKIRKYIEKDYQEIKRTWEEIGWLEPKEDKEIFKFFVESSRIMVAELNGAAEASVFSISGDLNYNEVKLPLHAVAAVTTSRISRKRGLAGKVTALALAREAAAGKKIAGLGMFEQGYYNLLGFGTGPYEHHLSFDPADLKVPKSNRAPCRLGAKDFQEMHENRLQRLQKHGSVNLYPPKVTRADLLYKDSGFGLGFRDPDSGELTHHFWISPDDVENGPYDVLWAIYRENQQFLELLSLLRDLGDQVNLVRIAEPAGVQLQDFLKQPMKSSRISKGGKHEVKNRALAYWQLRILDLENCIINTHLPGGEISFNLELIDPVEKFLPPEEEWQGVGGEYHLTIGTESEIKRGLKNGLPTLKTSVGVFTRMWMGSLPATGLALSDDLCAPEDLLKELDRVFLMPKPRLDWDF